MLNFLTFFEFTLGNMYIALIVSIVSFILKIYLFTSIIHYQPDSHTAKKSRFFLCLVLSAAIIEDLSWLLHFSRELSLWVIDYKLCRLVIRYAWAANAIRFLSLSLFIESLTQQKFFISKRQKFSIAIAGIFILLFIGMAFFYFQCNSPETRPWFELLLQRMHALYFSGIYMPISVFYTLRTIKRRTLPRIINKQLKIILSMLIIPDILIELIQAYPCEFPLTWIPNNLIIVTLSMIIITTLTFYCARRMVGLRFLNIRKHVQSSPRFSFVNNFQEVLGQLSQATSFQELLHISQQLFHKAFTIPVHATTLYVCSGQNNEPSQSFLNNTFTNATIDRALMHPESNLHEYLQQHKLLIYDEIAFNNFYEQNKTTGSVLQFLDTIHADIFIPIFNQKKIIACMVVERNARPETFYSSTERDEMLVFAGYIGNIINLMQKRNLESIIIKEKEMLEEIYNKHQEIRQYKESMRSFLRQNQQRKIGIIFYKNRKFSYGNREAKDLIPINLNTHEGHPLTKACRQIIREVQMYKVAQSCIVNDSEDAQLVVAGVPHLEQNTVILMIYYPEIADLIAKQIDLLKDPTNWDYVLYLETTEVGRLINQLIPGSGEHILQFKIELLKTALSTKATLLDMPADDLLPTVELLHHISMRQTLHVLDLEKNTSESSVAITLFGINPLFSQNPDAEAEPLLKRLHNSGTLFIQNIHWLSLEAQEHLVDLVRYGYFKTFRGEQKIFSNVRIICSSNQNLSTLTQEGKFSPQLLKELQKTSISLPSFMTLPEQEIEAMAQGFAQQALTTHTFDGLLEMGSTDHKKIISSRPSSVQEIKKRVQHILLQKTKNAQLEDTTFDPAFLVTDPQLAELARLGKHALKDAKTLSFLLNKLKSQNKVAAFLRVNRSSVSRRCKDFNLE